MTGLEHFHFLRPAWLLLVPVVAWLWWRVRVQQDPLRGWRAWMDRDLLAALTVGRQGHSENWGYPLKVGQIKN